LSPFSAQRCADFLAARSLPNMSTDIPADHLATLVPRDRQRQAARMAQDAFATIFRLTFAADASKLSAVLADLDSHCDRWCQAGAGPNEQALRWALLIGGLDQWGLAYSQAFGLTAIPALTTLLGALRNRLDATADARFQQYFKQIEEVESDAVDFKIELRRNIHLALWLAMTACDDEVEAQRITQALGSLMLALARRMPQLGWRLLADALAGIQIRLLDAPEGSGNLAQENTRQLFAALRASLPAEQYQAILAGSGQVVLAWQQSRRPQAH
jgi:hypothetical protein